MRLVGAAAVLLLLLHVAYAFAYHVYHRPAAGDLTFTSDFESGDASVWEDKGAIQVCCDDSLVIVDAPVRRGRRAARFTLRQSDPDVKGSKRAEVITRAALMGGEYWYAFSVFLPADWKGDQVPVTIAQWHAVPDVGFGEASSPPPLRLLVEEGQWAVVNIWDSKRLGSTLWRPIAPDGYVLQKVGAFEPGRWTDWVVHVRWSYESGGLLEVWKDRQLALRRDGPNTYNDALAPYMKLGIYVPRWTLQPPVSTVASHTIHFDEIRVAEGPATLLEMSPTQ
jgi:hypothetical protein